MLVGLVVIAAIGFELRTVLGMFFGVDLPVTPYVVAMIAVLSAIGVIFDLSRTAGGGSANR
jgi:hypothetical protein